MPKASCLVNASGILSKNMLGIVLQLPPFAAEYLAANTYETMAAHALLVFGWIPVFGVLVWGMTQLWVDFKQGKYFGSLKWVLLEVKVPESAIQTPKGMENFFANLSGTKSGITWRESWLLGKIQAIFSFEIISNGGEIKFIIRTSDKYTDLVEALIYAQYPEAQISQIEDYTNLVPHKFPDDEYDIFGAEMKLSRPSYFPIRTYEDFEHTGEKEGRFKDPLLPGLELMGKLQPGEHMWLQFVITPPDSQDWSKEGEKFLGTIMGREAKKKTTMMGELAGAISSLPSELLTQTVGVSLGGGAAAEKKADDFRAFKLTASEKIQMDLVAEKITKIGWLVKVRYLYVAKKSKFRKGMMASGMKGIFQPYSSQLLNGFAAHGPAVTKDDYFWQSWSLPKKQTNLIRRFAARNPFAGGPVILLNAEELATVFHFPAADARTPMITSLGARRAEAPTTLPFADDKNGDGIPDWKQMHGQESAVSARDAASVVKLPTPQSPTAQVGAQPQPNLPAPLPPGLDLSDEPIDLKGEAPPNLPL